MNRQLLKAGYTTKEILIYGSIILVGILCLLLGVLALIWNTDDTPIQNNSIDNGIGEGGGTSSDDQDTPPIFDDDDIGGNIPGDGYDGSGDSGDNAPGDNSGSVIPPSTGDDDITTGEDNINQDGNQSTGEGNRPSYTLAGNYFSTKGSLVYATSSNVSTIAKNYANKVYKSYFLGDAGMFYTESTGEQTYLDLKEMFEIIFAADKNNFNKINWINCGNLKTDSKTGLKYPSSSIYDLNYFVELLTPYLQSYSVPLSLSAGASSSYSDLVNYNIGVMVADYASHQIEVTKYNVNTTKTTEVQETVTTNSYTAKVNTTCIPYTDNNGDTYYICSDQLIDSGRNGMINTNSENTTIISTSTSKSLIEKFVITKAYMFDTAVERSYAINKASTSNKNQATSSLVRSSEEYERNNTLNVRQNYVVYELPTVGEHTVEYTVEECLKQTIDYVWSDTLNLVNNIQRPYTVADIISYINGGKLLDATKSDYNTKKIEMLNSGLLSMYELAYYSTYEKTGNLNLFDIINASPKIYNQYLESEPRSEYIGYSRDALTSGYDVLKDALASLVDRGAWFAYGSSLGIDTVSTNQFNVSSITSLTMDGMSFPINPEDLNLAKVTDGLNPRVQMQGPYGKGDKRVWGYANHLGIDITWGSYNSPEAKQLSQTCVDSYGGGYHCYIGGKVYAMMDMQLVGVYFSPYNKYYSTGVANYKNQGSLRAGGTEGTYMVFKTADGMKVVYYHIFPDYQWLSEFAATYTGKTVSAGTYLGYMGNSGNSTGTHLHLGIYANTSYSTSNYTLYFLITLVKKLTENGVDMSGLGWSTSGGKYTCSSGTVTCTDGIPNPVIGAWNAP